jgi:hypothetical protein
MNISQLTALEDLALEFARKIPDWVSEDSEIKIRRSDRHYFVLDEVDAGRLDNLRKMIPIIIEERRKRETNE